MAPGAWVGRYRLGTLVSRGGMGEVWRAYDETLDRPVALKLLYEDLGEPVARERFLREARAVARLQHPNIVAVYDVGESDGRPYLVMELVDGRTVADELAEHGAFSFEAVRAIGASTAAALRFAHAAGVVHRDIKPANLVLHDDSTVKLIDFGLARLTEEGSSLTPDGAAMGTIAYVAPESARGVDNDERSDLYSLGCVLYELLCGRPPFVGDVPSIAYAHVREEPDHVSTHRVDAPDDLAELVMSLLAKDPALRPQSAEAVRQDLLGLDLDGDLERTPAPDSDVTPDRRRRMPVLAMSGGVVAASLLGMAGWWAAPTFDASYRTTGVESSIVRPDPIVQPDKAKPSMDLARVETVEPTTRTAPSPESEASDRSNADPPDSPDSERSTVNDSDAGPDASDTSGTTTTAVPPDGAEPSDPKTGNAQPDKADRPASLPDPN